MLELWIRPMRRNTEDRKRTASRPRARDDRDSFLRLRSGQGMPTAEQQAGRPSYCGEPSPRRGCGIECCGQISRDSTFLRARDMGMLVAARLRKETNIQETTNPQGWPRSAKPLAAKLEYIGNTSEPTTRTI